MSAAKPEGSAPITSVDQLVEHFKAGIKSPDQRRVGMEHEKFIIDRQTLRPTPYEGPKGIGRLFELLAERHGYTPYYDGEHVIAAWRRNAEGMKEALTIEPAGQFELSGAPVVTMKAAEDELTTHLEHVRQVCDELGLAMIGAGANGLNTLDEIGWMPKSRYNIMRRYMTEVGTMGHWMMKGTCTVQANFDYTSEADAVDMLRTGLYLSPIVSALFAHSPIWKGKPSGYMTTRCFFWTDTDNDRCGFPLFMLEDDFGFKDYVEYTLGVPMYLIERDGKVIDKAGHSFRDFIKEGYQGTPATMEDYETHLSTLFPEVRMKHYIEVRGPDAGPADYMLALPALWKGIFYDAQARREGAALVADLNVEQRQQLFQNAIRWSLNGQIPGTGTQNPTSIRDVATSLIDIAAAGLDRLGNPTDGSKALAGENESAYLDPLRAAVTNDKAPSPAHALLQRWHDLDGDTAKWFLEQTL